MNSNINIDFLNVFNLIKIRIPYGCVSEAFYWYDLCDVCLFVSK
jgi:hypothetical protein